MPLLHQPVLLALTGNRKAIELTAEPDGEIANVDHLLYFASRLFRNLASFQRHQQCQIGFVLTQPFSDPPDDFAPPRRRHHAPLQERYLCGASNQLHILGPRSGNRRQFATIVVGQDMTVGFVGPAGDEIEFTISESLVPRIRRPQAVCILKG